MPYKDLHDEPFDNTTISKLEIFEDYAEAWIPTFIMQNAPVICIYDFFAGTGYDKAGVPGSTIRILEKLIPYLKNIFQNNLKVVIHYNEYQPKRRKQDKYELLQQSIGKYLEQHKDLKRAIKLEPHNEDFEQLFPKVKEEISRYPSLVYLDQNGMKFLSKKYLLQLEEMKQTDFLYFVSASYFWRFGNSEEFKEHLDIDMTEAKKQPYKFIHRHLIQQLRKKLPVNTKLKLYPFSLKKGANIHGIIFGASHIRAVDKFLTIAWKRNGANGQANYDIGDDAHKNQLNMFGENVLTTIELFKENVTNEVLAERIKNNVQLFDYTMAAGHIGTHAAECLKNLKRQGKVKYDSTSPLITYDNAYKKKVVLNYTILKT